MDKKKEETNFEKQVTNVQPAESLSSIEIKQTTKGVTFTVKVYDANVILAQTKAEKIFDDLTKKYPQQQVKA